MNISSSSHIEIISQSTLHHRTNMSEDHQRPLGDRKRSRSPDRQAHRGHRVRSPHRHHHRSHKHAPAVEAEAPKVLPYNSRHLTKRDYTVFKPMFALYLDIQKGKDLEEMDEVEAKGRWKSFIGKWYILYII
jgi:hypothetical protein